MAQAIRDEIIEELLQGYSSPQDLLGEEGLFKELRKRLLERALGAELTEHLGYERGDPAGRGSGNSRNGYSSKTVLGDDGAIEIAVPRDRQGSFEPQIVAKGQTRLDGFDDRIISLYARGLSVREIQAHLLARWLARHGMETHVVQPSSVPVDRRARRAKSDGIDAELLLRTLLAWFRGEPRVCSMVPIPNEADEDARRRVREREELVADRISLVNRIGAVLATLGVRDYNPLRRDRRARLEALRTALGDPLPSHARARILRVLDRLDLVCAQITELERSRDAVLEEEAPDRAEKMIQQLVGLRGIGVQSATVLVREAFVREFANGKTLGSYAGLSPTPFSSGATEREQGIGKADNRRLRTVMIELAWLWQRYQPGSAQVDWFRERVSGTGRRMRKVMVVAMARRLLIALWRFATQGVVPGGAVMKPAY